MITEAATLTCSICGEPSHDICIFCTKDTCHNHRCQRCKRCSDCCECEVPLSEIELAPEPEIHAAAPTQAEHAAPPAVSEPAAISEAEAVSAPAPPEASEEPDLYNPPAQVIETLAEAEESVIFETEAKEAPAEPPEPGHEH